MSARRRPATLGFAVGGVLVGHWLTYLAVAPIAHSRDALLHQTGHAYLGMANDLALVAVLAAMATMFIGQLTSPTPLGRLGAITRRVVLFQVSAFVLLEVLERVTAGSSLAELIHTGILPIGIPVQVGLGFLVALAIRWLLRAADQAAAVLGHGAVPPPRILPRLIPPGPVFVPPTCSLSAAGVRGPPSPV